MQQVATASRRQRAELFQDTAEEAQIPKIIIEKDFWVCWVLHVLYSTDTWRDRLLFKGGTSLSKAFNLIDRFSEDIDLVLKVDGFPEEAMLEDRSGKKQKEFRKELMAASRRCIREALKPLLETQAATVRGRVVEEGELPVLLVEYDRCWSDADYQGQYIPQSVKLEIGPRGLWMPCALYSIHPYAAEQFPGKFSNSSVELPVMEAVLTFWEKACILHVTACSGDARITVNDRYSRHYYDLMRIAGSGHKEHALAQPQLLQSVVDFSRRYFPGPKEHFDSAKPGSFRLIPSDSLIKDLTKDYNAMQYAGMFFREAPKFSELIEGLQNLEGEINRLAVPDAGIVRSAMPKAAAAARPIEVEGPNKGKK